AEAKRERRDSSFLSKYIVELLLDRVDTQNRQQRVEVAEGSPYAAGDGSWIAGRANGDAHVAQEIWILTIADVPDATPIARTAVLCILHDADDLDLCLAASDPPTDAARFAEE